MEKVLYKFDFLDPMTAEWFQLALISSALYALNNILTKYTVDKHIRDPIALMMFIGVMDTFLASYAYFFKGVVLALTWPHIVALLQGFFYFIGRICILEAMKHEEVSRVMTMSLTSPLSVAILAYFLLGEAFPTHIYLGILMIVLSSVIITYRKVRKPGQHRWICLTLMSVLALSVGSVCAKYATLLGFWYVVFGGSAGYVLLSLMLFTYPTTRKAFQKAFWMRKHYLLVASIYAIIVVGWFVYIKAFMMGPISLVSAVGGTISLFTLAYAVVLSLFWPKILKEEIDRKTLGQKLLAALLMLWGVYLLA